MTRPFNSAPNIYTFDSLRKTCEGNSASRDGVTWHPARPCGFYSIGSRLRCAWMVFTGRADALVWPIDQ